MTDPKRPPEDKEPKDNEERSPDVRRKQTRFLISYLVFGLIGMFLFQEYVLHPIQVREVHIPYSEFKARINEEQILEVTLGEERLTGIMLRQTDAGIEEVAFTTVAIPDGDPTLIEALDASGATYTVNAPPSAVGSFLLSYLLPLTILGGLWYTVYSTMGRGARGGGVFGVGRSKATQVTWKNVGLTYRDVGGGDEAIDELQEIIHFLKTPERFARLGGRIPKGVLLMGPPGTGKTLLAKATAGEAQVPFFETSGSEFVEMYVGVGAARVRDLFAQARKVAPAIVFIDEIDAIGQSRGGAIRSGGNEEREQTLNQLLSEIDGFDTEATKPVIIMAATNRPEILDPALMRAGRFDRQVTVGAPDLTGRLQILRIHCQDVKLAQDFDLDRAARMTSGFTGADLANAMNEAALLAARRQAEDVTLLDFEAAIERVIAGPETRSRVMKESERISVAYHESGHALVACLVPNADPVAKVSIVPRGRGALGYTLQMPEEDRYLMTREELEDRIAVMLGGRAAELITFGTISTGASDDIRRATDLATRMVTEFGMSERLGVVRYMGQQYQFLDANDSNASASPDTLKVIEEEVQRITAEQYARAQRLLSDNRETLERLTQRLLEIETLDSAEVLDALHCELPAA